MAPKSNLPPAATTADNGSSSSRTTSSSPSKRSVLPLCSGLVLLSCLLAFTLQIFFFSPISPDLLLLPPVLSSASTIPTTSYLQSVTKLGEGILNNPEDVCMDRDGLLYTATRDGWIKRMQKNGTWENWKLIDNSNALLGITTTPENEIIVCDADKGLLKVTENGVTVLASHVNGSRISLADDVIVAKDGTVYFSEASTKFGLRDYLLDLLEAKPHGMLLKYDPSLNETSILLDGLFFANGVALSKDEDYLVVCETWKFRCLKYWLKDERKGERETFIENLPGGPDNINLAPDGSFWVALLQLSSPGMEFVHTSKVAKHLLVAFPKLISMALPVHKKAAVMNVAANGNIIKMFEDPDGKVMSFVTSALEFEDHLYLGSLNSNFLGKLPLKSI